MLDRQAAVRDLFPALDAPASPQPGRALGLTVGLFILAFVTYIVGGSLFYAAALGIDRHPGTPLKLVFEIIGWQFLAAGVALSVFLHGRSRESAGIPPISFRNPGVRTILTAAGIVIPVLLGVTLLSLFFQTFLPGYHLKGNAQELVSHPKALPLAEKALVLLWAAVEAPLVEETLFRGILFQGLRTVFRAWAPPGVSVFVAALVSGLMFGLAHFQPQTLPILAFLGVVLAYVYQYGRSVLASATLHGLVNFLAVMALFAGK